MGESFASQLKQQTGADAEKRYSEFGHLAASVPEFAYNTPDRDAQIWLARVVARLEQSADPGDRIDAGFFKAACDGLGSTVVHETSVQTIVLILHRALARAEARAPAAAQGAFLPAGDAFTALVAVGKVLGGAQASALIVDPYASENLLTEFAVLAPEGIAVRVLADKADCKPGLKPAAERWVAQYGGKRPLDVRLAAKKSLHDRLIAVDERHAWSVGQSFNALAQRAPTSLVRVDPETARMKIDAYDAIWQAAEPIS